MTDPDRDALDYLAITRLLGRYADVVTRRAWPELQELFAPDATVTVDTQVGEPIELVGAARVGEFIGGSVERFEFFELVPLNLVVDVDGDSASGRAYQVEVRQSSPPGGTRTRTASTPIDTCGPGTDGASPLAGTGHWPGTALTSRCSASRP